MYFRDDKQLHVKYQKHEAIVSIPDGEILEGSLPNPKSTTMDFQSIVVDFFESRLIKN